jgi:hypothetical protein
MSGAAGAGVSGGRRGRGRRCEERLDGKGDSPEGGEFPAAALVREEEAGRAVGRPDRAEEDRDQGDRHPAGPDPEDQRDAAEELHGDHEVGERPGQAEAREVAGGAGGREDEELQAGLGEKEDTQRDAQEEGGEVGVVDAGDEPVAGWGGGESGGHR